jgi:hypothetical protein
VKRTNRISIKNALLMSVSMRKFQKQKRKKLWAKMDRKDIIGHYRTELAS